MTVKDYLSIVSTEDNPYQRAVLKSSFYKKLIEDLLNDTTMPPISIVWTSNIFDLSKDITPTEKCLIIDGLQRTNCLNICI